MSRDPRTSAARGGLNQRFFAAIVILLALTLLSLTWFGIRESQADSYRLLVMQGTAFTEALTHAAENAIESEHFFDFLVHKRFSEIVTDITQIDLSKLSDTDLVQIAATHSLYAIFVYGMDSTLVTGGVARGSVLRPPEYVVNKVDSLIANPQSNYILLLDQGDSPDEMVHYYIEMSNKLDRVVLLVADAGYYVEALKKTQIGYLAQKLAEENGVAYIIYQSEDGIVFSSRKTGELLSIASDPFLSKALDGDTVMHRDYLFNNIKVLELVQPLATKDYPVGLLRVGLSLRRYNAIINGYNIQIITLATTLLVLVIIVLLYLNSRTKRREIARQYEEIKSISDRIFDEMRIGVAATDAAGKIILTNAAFERILESPDATGRPWNEVLVQPSLSFETFTAGRELSMEKEIAADVNGKPKDLLISVSRLSEADNFRGIVAVLYDVTQYRELQQRSARKERLSEMGNLAAGVAHEIRNPLNTISIAIQRLASEFRPSDNAQEFIAFTDQIKGETRRLNEIITRFLALTREEQKRRSPILLAPLFDEFIGLVKFEAEKLNLQISTQAEPNLTISGDRDSIKQILVNLFNNAKESLSGKSGEIRVTARLDGDRAIMRFEDSGKGVPESLRERLFTPFFTTKQSGTGLGLSTVYKIVSDMEGEIVYEVSELGGACFTITLPAQ